MSARLALFGVLMASPVAAEVTVIGRVEQGGIAIGRVSPGAQVMLDGKAIATTPDGEFVIGFERDAKSTAKLVVMPLNAPAETQTLKVAKRAWQIEKVQGLPQNLVTPDPVTEAKIAADNKIMVAARARTESEAFYKVGFIQPAQGRISGVYGSQRILNGTPRAPHVGLDIAAPIGTPVRAAADGVVSVAAPDMVLTGRTVVIEHGFGLDTIYIHMNAISVKEGDHVKQGQVIGEIGKSGRANGPHLHFGVTWFDVRLDPQTVLAVLPAPQAGAQ